VELQVHKQNDVEVGDEDGVKLFCTNQFTQKLKLIGKGGPIIYTLILHLTAVYFYFLINHAYQDSKLRPLSLIPY
jgi:hypothetical protein